MESCNWGISLLLSSVTEREIQLGLFSTSAEKRQYCSAFVREITDVNDHLDDPKMRK